MRNVEIKSLTGLRGLAAAFVAIYHFGRFIPQPQIHWAIHKGYLCVDLFFALSGFVMATTYRSLFAEHVKASSFGRFMWLRVARVWPLFVVATMFSFFVHGATTWQLIVNLLMVQGWGFSASIDPVLWSVSIEFVAYIVFPWLFLAMHSEGRGRFAFIASVVGMTLLIGGFIAKKNGGSIDLVGYYSNTAAQMGRCLVNFTLGMIAWKLSLDRSMTSITNRSSFGMVCAGIIAVLFAVNANDVLICAVFPALILGVSHDKGLVARVLSARAIHSLGILSFAIYALQGPFYDSVEPFIGNAVTRFPVPISTFAYYMTIAVALLALSAVAHYLIERPCRLAMRGVLAHSRKPAVA